MVQNTCYCSKSTPISRRCSNKYWTCNTECNQLLTCKQHKCTKICHPGQCQDCNKTSIQFCRCKKNRKEVLCTQTIWKCEEVKRIAINELNINKHFFLTRYAISRSLMAITNVNLFAMILMNVVFVLVLKFVRVLVGNQVILSQINFKFIKKLKILISTGFLKPCTEEIPPCGDTCDKLLDCNIHRCVRRCHNGPCDTVFVLLNHHFYT